MNTEFLKTVKAAAKKLGGTVSGTMIGMLLTYISNVILMFSKMIPDGLGNKIIGAVAWLVLYFEPELREQVLKTETDIDDTVLNELIEAATELKPA